MVVADLDIRYSLENNIGPDSTGMLCNSNSTIFKSSIENEFAQIFSNLIKINTYTEIVQVFRKILNKLI